MLDILHAQCVDARVAGEMHRQRRAHYFLRHAVEHKKMKRAEKVVHIFVYQTEVYIYYMPGTCY